MKEGLTKEAVGFSWDLSDKAEPPMQRFWESVLPAWAEPGEERWAEGWPSHALLQSMSLLNKLYCSMLIERTQDYSEMKHPVILSRGI